MGIGSVLIGKIVENERKKYKKELDQLMRINRMPEEVEEKAFDRFHLYHPAALEKGAVQVILNVHGGGMIMGDRSFNRFFNARMAQKGYVVIACAYPLTPENELPGMVEGLAGSMRLGLTRLEREGFLPKAVYLTADSAGAFLSLYLYACRANGELRKQMGIEDAVFEGLPEIRGMGLCSGMFYSRLKDSIGRFVGPQIWGKKPEERFGPWTDLEYVLKQVRFPKLCLFTAEGDFLKDYTRRFYKACLDAGQEVRLKEFEDPKLIHAFQVFHPGIHETMQTIALIDVWFSE